ncbi:DUF2961 domain-containing protein [Draconibacterium sp.]|nr:DUF2961 domain-containing protein [Draconibacterium sp.]
MRKNVYFKVLTMTFLSLWGIVISAQITTETLLNEMVDLKGLAEYPSPVYQTIQYSSYDRHSISPDQPGWFANSDGFGGESIPGFEKVLKEPGKDGIGRYLICDVKGPGAVVRLWTARIAGNLEVYLDGSETALYEGPARDFFYNTYDAISGSKDQFNQKGAFFQNTAGYYPIPFQKEYKMIWEGNINDLHFYHVQVRTYEQGTNVKSFQTSDLKKYKNPIDQISKALLNPHESFPPKGNKKVFSKTVEAGQQKQIGTIIGEKAVSWLKIKVMAEDVSGALRQNIIKISFDGASSAQVQSPVGDFFGAAPGINPYHSLPFSVLPDGSMICRYFMPFKDSVNFEIQNLGDQPATIFIETYPEPYSWKKNSMYFRARWRTDHGLLASYDPSQDIPYLLASGKGVCIGAAAFIYNPTSVPSSYGNWWGEGDEKIFIDQASFPAFFGTGSEDYFNYAWSSSAIFTHAYCGQPRNDGPANRGFVSNYRWHILDKIPFSSGFAFYMELMSHEPVENFSYGRMVYLYSKPGMYDDHLPITKEDVRPLNLPEKWYPVGKKGSNNAIFYQAEQLVENQKLIYTENDNLWSGGKIMVWEPGSQGKQLILNISVEEAGNYSIVLTVGKDDEGGSFVVKSGESKLEFRGSETVDLKDPYRIIARNYRSAPVKLKSGINPVIIEPAEGNNGKIKIDFIWIMKSN